MNKKDFTNFRIVFAEEALAGTIIPLAPTEQKIHSF
jgi:hypothetical protein